MRNKIGGRNKGGINEGGINEVERREEGGREV